MNFLDALRKQLLFFDGAMGTQLQERGLQPGEIPETWNIEKPQVIQDVYTSYLEAGAHVTKANTFGVNRYKLAGTSYTVPALVRTGLTLARQAQQAYRARHAEEARPLFVALDIGSLGKLLQPLGTLSFDEAYEAFAEIVQAGSGLCDLILIETMNDPYEMKAALLAAKEHSTLPVVVSMVIDEKGKLLTGGSIPAAVCMLEGMGADCIGMNCALGPKQMLRFMPELTGCCSKPILIMPNAGMPELEGERTVYRVSPEAFASDQLAMVHAGAQALGGCCGTTPQHIQSMTSACRGAERQAVVDHALTMVSSYGQHVAIGHRPVIIGERINPTGKKKLKKALVEKRYDYILEEAYRQQEQGAQILDVNVGLPELDEAEVMDEVMRDIQSISKLPLQIDTSDPVTMERALRHYNGKAMINSVSGKQQVMDQIFPLVKKYGGVVVGLTLDDSGIPETAEGRVAIARRIIEEAARYGIAKKDIVIDTLTMTMSTGVDQGKVTLEALRRVHEELGVGTVLGVSNISFGLPNRDLINASFLTMALDRGLSAPIMNPGAHAMRQAFDVYLTLQGYDANCQSYIEKYSAPMTAAQTVKEASAAAKANERLEEQESALARAVIKGMSESASRLTADMLQSREPLSIVDEELVPALDTVGKAFETGRMFLPQLLMSAQAAQAAFAQIKEALKRRGGGKSKGKIVLATVKGDIHDIGKNIVGVLLENYGFEVLDLGKNVEPALIVETARREGVKLVGLSALMTTTVPFMQQTIELLKKELPACKVMVGGAVLTQAYADQMGADFYGKDAMQSVRYANQLFAEDT